MKVYEKSDAMARSMARWSIEHMLLHAFSKKISWIVGVMFICIPSKLKIYHVAFYKISPLGLAFPFVPFIISIE